MWSSTGAGQVCREEACVSTASCLHMSRTCLPTTVCSLASSPAPAAMHGLLAVQHHRTPATMRC